MISVYIVIFFRILILLGSYVVCPEEHFWTWIFVSSEAHTFPFLLFCWEHKSWLGVQGAELTSDRIGSNTANVRKTLWWQNSNCISNIIFTKNVTYTMHLHAKCFCLDCQMIKNLNTCTHQYLLRKAPKWRQFDNISQLRQTNALKKMLGQVKSI